MKTLAFSWIVIRAKSVPEDWGNLCRFSRETHGESTSTGQKTSGDTNGGALFGLHLPDHAGGLKGSLQLGVFSQSLFQDWRVRISIFPEREELLVSGSGFRGVAGERIGAAHLQVGDQMICG